MSKIDTVNHLRRSAGILLHPTSLWTTYGIGDLGPAAFDFIQYLNRAGQSFWQMLPLGPTGYLDSPYQCISAFAGNPLLISPDELVAMGLITKNEAINCLEDENGRIKWTMQDKVQYAKVRTAKYCILKIAYNNMFSGNIGEEVDWLKEEFSEFCVLQKYWLDDFVL